MPEYGSGIYETGVVLEPIRPSVADPMYYDEQEYTFEDYNDIPLAPPTAPPPVKRQVSYLALWHTTMISECSIHKQCILFSTAYISRSNNIYSQNNNNNN